MEMDWGCFSGRKLREGIIVVFKCLKDSSWKGEFDPVMFWCSERGDVTF